MSVLNDCFKHIIINSAFFSGKYNKAKYRECFYWEQNLTLTETHSTHFKNTGKKRGITVDEQAWF